MNRVDIVRQQRNVPLLNELLFSVLDAKPSDPIEFLIDTLQRISDDVEEYRSKLTDIRKSRKVLREALVRASRKRKPPCTTLLLHAARGLAHCPLLHDMYDSMPEFPWEAPEATVLGASANASHDKGSDRCEVGVTASTKLQPLDKRPTANPPEDAESRTDSSNNNSGNEVEMQWARRVQESLQKLLRSETSSNGASAKRLPAIHALAAVVDRARNQSLPSGRSSVAHFDGIEVLLVATLEITRSPSKGEQGGGQEKTVADKRGRSIESLEATDGDVTQSNGNGGALWRGLTVLLEVLQSHGGAEVFPSLTVLDNALQFIAASTVSTGATLESNNGRRDVLNERVSNENTSQDASPSSPCDVFAVLAAALEGEEASCPLLHALLHMPPIPEAEIQTKASSLPLLTLLADIEGASVCLPNLTLLLPLPSP